MLLLKTQMAVFGEIHGFLQLSRIGIFGTKTAYHHLEKSTLQNLYLPKNKSSASGK
jgi:hypothetical protein